MSEYTVKTALLLSLILVSGGCTALTKFSDYSFSTSESDTDVDVDSDVDNDPEPDGDSDADFESDADTESDADLETDTDIDTDTECDPITNTGCEAGKRCHIFTLDGQKFDWACLDEKANMAEPGEPCAWSQGHPLYGMFDNCEGGSICFGGTAENPTCIKLCGDGAVGASQCRNAYRDENGNPEDGICHMDFDSILSPSILGCREPSPCDPHCQDCPNVGELCLAAGDQGGNFANICTEQASRGELPGEGIANDPCIYSNQCVPGFACLGSLGCQPYCNFALEGEPTCGFETCGSQPGQNGDEECLALDGTEDTWMTIDLGICLSPE